MPFTTHSRKQRPDVLAALHAQAKSEAWVECHSRVGRELGSTKDPSSITIFPRILQRIPVLLFAGDQDFICNYLGQESLIQALTWNGGTGLGVSTGSPLLTTNIIILTGSGNPNLDCWRHTGWNVGLLEEFDLCEGSI